MLYFARIQTSHAQLNTNSQSNIAVLSGLANRPASTASARLRDGTSYDGAKEDRDGKDNAGELELHGSYGGEDVSKLQLMCILDAYILGLN